jgi:PAS domain S-box-containing protein
MLTGSLRRAEIGALALSDRGVYTVPMRLADPAFRAIFEDAPVGICVVDRNIKVIDVNAAYCDMLGRTEAEVMGMHIPDFTHPDDRDRDADKLPRVLSGELSQYKTEKRYIRKDGAVVWARIVVTALLDPSGKSSYAFSMAQVIDKERALRGFLPVCPKCERVKEKDGLWTDLDTFVRASASAAISRENCPDCA